MHLSKPALEKLRLLINEETQYRSGPELVEFFNALGFDDTYGQGFPSRWYYTDQKLEALNGSDGLRLCIQDVLSPVRFVGRLQDLDAHIQEFNQYLVFDDFKVVRATRDVRIERVEQDEVESLLVGGGSGERDNVHAVAVLSVDGLELGDELESVLQHRITEMGQCFGANAPLATIILAGSTLEGVFLALGRKFPRAFNVARAAPKNRDGVVRPFRDWTLNAFIDVAKEIDVIELDTKAFSHALRDFRNYIHPNQQLESGFHPRPETAKLCLEVLQTVVADIAANLDQLETHNKSLDPTRGAAQR